jgi:hypothetical protein
VWALYNHTPYAAERSWIRDKQGFHQWLVAVKATFDVRPDGKVTLADKQVAPLLAPAYRGDPAQSSLVFESDLLALKPGTDVVLEATACAPRDRPVATVPVSLRVNEQEKTLLVHGTRVYYRGAVAMTTSAPRPFTRRPIVYEEAFGGNDLAHPDRRKQRIDLRNPVGKGVAADPATRENQAAHTIEYPGEPADKVGPAGFGPLASFWSPRAEWAGTYDAEWERTRKPLLPRDYDDRFAQAAPADQQFARALRGGETVTVVNMTPEGALRFQLPKIHLTFDTMVSRRIEEHRASLATVHLATETMKLSLIWQTALRVATRDADYLDYTLIGEKPFL